MELRGWELVGAGAVPSNLNLAETQSATGEQRMFVPVSLGAPNNGLLVIDWLASLIETFALP